MKRTTRALACAPLPLYLPLYLSLAAGPALAEDPPSDILVTARPQDMTIEASPATSVSIDAEAIRTKVNAVTTEDTLKYLPSLIVRKRNFGDTQAPLATRTSGVGSSARSLVYADGALLSALIGNNNSNASPRWGLVSPQEIASIEVLYGPFSAAYPGNSIGAVVNIVTRMPDRFEASMTAGTAVQSYSLYGAHHTLPTYQLGGTVGDRFGPLSLFASVDHVESRSQPVVYVTGTAPAGTSGVPSRTRTGAATSVLGAGGLEHQVQDRFKLKAALDLGPDIRLTYVGALFLNNVDSRAETYLGSAYTSAFSNGVYRFDERHWSHSATLAGHSGRLDWQLIGTLYDYAHDVQRTPTGLLPAANGGGRGNITRLDGTGWKTLDAKGAWAIDDAATHRISFGAHGDWFRLNSNRYTAAGDWRSDATGTLNQQSKGRTRTTALWAQDAWKLAEPLTLTVGGRYEWWKAYGGRNYSLSPAILADQPTLSAHHVSPKAALAWAATRHWTVRASFGEAWRFPTVGELYQVVTTPVPAVPNPNLKPERALSEELALERRDTHGSFRLSLFNEAIKDALISQSGPLPGFTPVQFGTYVQNVDRTRARGVELAAQRDDVVPRVDLSGSVTYTDATTRRDAIFPAAEGQRLLQVPRWKATLVGTWRPTDRLSLTASGRYASRMYGTLDNSDSVGNVYMGFYKYLVVDLRADMKVNQRMRFALGVDNLNNDKYFLFHPFPQRTLFAQAQVTL
jgi:iron complex outermembrane recepter protein